MTAQDFTIETSRAVIGLYGKQSFSSHVRRWCSLHTDCRAYQKPSNRAEIASLHFRLVCLFQLSAECGYIDIVRTHVNCANRSHERSIFVDAVLRQRSLGPWVDDRDSTFATYRSK